MQLHVLYHVAACTVQGSGYVLIPTVTAGTVQLLAVWALGSCYSGLYHAGILYG